MSDQTVAAGEVVDAVDDFERQDWERIVAQTAVRLVPLVVVFVALDVPLGWQVLVGAVVVAAGAGVAIWRCWAPGWASAFAGLAAGLALHIVCGLVAVEAGWTLSPWFALLLLPGSVVWWMAAAGWAFPWGLEPEPEPEPEPVAPAKSYDNLTIGTCTETGEPWVLPFRAAMVLLVGTTDSGKSSVIWSIVSQIVHGIPAREVRLVCVDPKNVEFGRARGLFDWWIGPTRYTGLDGLPPDLAGPRDWLERVAWALEREVDLMNERTDAMIDRGEVQHVPSPGEPMTILIVDELLRITATVADTKLKARINSALTDLLSNGRAAGWRVIAATQLVDASVLAWLRKLIHLRICLRVGSKFDVDMALGPEARTDFGADAHLISQTEPGTAYVWHQESGTAVRVRARFVDRQEVDGMVAKFGTPVVAPVVAPDGPPTLEFPTVSHVADRVAAVWPAGEKSMHIDELAELLGESSDELAGQLRDAGGPIQRRVTRQLADGSRSGKRGLYWDSFVAWLAGLK